jgi:Fic family protein
VTATEVLANIAAMSWAMRQVGRGDDITLDHLLGAHRRLLEGTRLQEYGGVVRDQQNWIGGSSYNPCSASFVPPPPERVPQLLDDLRQFSNTDGLPPVVQAALAHAQFETIHPFVDGNGRIGRVLIHLVLRRRGVSLRAVPPISLILATWSQDYVAGLVATRYRGTPTTEAAMTGLNRWVSLFATACRRSIEDAETFEDRVSQLQASWRRRLGSIRRDSALDRLVRALPGAPVLTVSAAAERIDRSFQATNGAIDRAVHAGVLQQVNVGRRNRAFEAPELIQTFTDLERRLASPTGDTRAAPPARRVPLPPHR